ncbi:M81 family metallopeptidase [Paracoccus alkanivorans]|uniref:Microcystin LR degradation protein MlrC N-terminal domain-containing protein n=1 Tax=Paracoccus alkanivorans TaxID=2116655 RepID=A0A3M0M958_9RHOB|nr:hypothetical protein C9E81_13400 [Paracoccus alkanivorans]
MRQLVLDMRALKQEPGVLSVSLAHAFPWGDVAGATASAWCISDGDPALAETMARRIVRRF